MSYVQTDKGEKLKQVRESKSISLETVHEATKIPMDALRAIEEGYTVRTLSEFYYRGFLKIYAQYLGVDVKEIVDDYKEEKIPEPVKDYDPSISPQEVIQSFFTNERKQLIAKIIGVLIVLFIFAKVVGFIKGFFTRGKDKTRVTQTQNQTQKADAQTAEEKRRSARAVRTVASEGAGSVSKAAPKETAAPAQKKVSLTVRAKKNSWLQIKTDGNVVFQSTLKQGVAETWTANESIELSGKNINQLEFELNGKMIGTLGRADRKARKLIVTKDGLSVKR